MKWAYVLYLTLIMCSMGCLKTRAEVSSFRQYQNNQTQVAQMQKSSSFDHNSRLGEIEESLRVLTGKMEEIEFKQQNLEKNADKLERLENHPALQELNKKLLLILEEMKAQKSDILDLKSQFLTQDKSKSDVVSEKDPLAQAEELFDAKDYRRAILSFQKYREQNPKGSKFANATYKIGFSFEKLNMVEEAKSFYLEVIEKFPKSPEASKAKARIKKIR